MRGEGRVFTRTMLLERVWDFHFDPKTSVVETHISRLRAKIDRPFETAVAAYGTQHRLQPACDRARLPPAARRSGSRSPSAPLRRCFPLSRR